ncbi:MAG: hypothetical protein U0003_05485 [Vampirovibrionales bacterium]
MMRTLLTGLLTAALIANTVLVAPSHAGEGNITLKTVGAGALSLLIWPGIGQAINSEPGDKVAAHAIVGLLPPFRFWSGYDALVNRKGGYWDGKI